MLRSFSALEDQLSLACKHSGAKWAVYIYQSMSSWRLLAEHGLSKGRRKEILKFVQDEDSRKWLDQVLTGGRVKTRAVRSRQKTWRCTQIYAFPGKVVPGVLLAGADDLGPEAQAYFKMLTVDLPHMEPVILQRETKAAAGLDAANALSSSDFMRITLDNLLQVMPSEQAYLALANRGAFRVSALYNLPADLNGMEISGEDKVILDLVEQAGILEKDTNILEVGGIAELPTWVYLPFVYDRQVLGFAAFGAQKGYSPQELLRASQAARLLSPLINREIELNAAQRFIQQLSLIDKLNSLAMGGITPEDYAAAVSRLFSGAFKSDHVNLWMLDRDSNSFYDLSGDREAGDHLPAEGTLEGTVLKVQQPVLIDNIASHSRYSTINPGVQVKLAAPLRFHHEAIGVISLERMLPDPFSPHDEMLIELLSGQLAATLERLRVEQMAKTSMNAMHLFSEIQNTVTRTTDSGKIAQQMAELLVDNFSWDVVQVMLLADRENELEVAGAAGSDDLDLKAGARYQSGSGMPGEVLAANQHVLVKNVGQREGYSALPGWTPGSLACIPISVQGTAIGVINIEDRHTDAIDEQDIRLINLMATQMAISIRNARLYQELDERIREQEMVEERLIRSAKLAAVGEMAAGVAHELNNPLTTVTGFAELILDTMSKDSPEYEDMSLVLQEAHRARGVVRRLLDFSRQSEVLWIEVDINELLSTVLALVHHLALTSGVDVRVEFWDELPRIRADRNQMQQVFLNLIHNAIQAMPGGGQLVLRTQVSQRDGEPWISVEVQDNGEGIQTDDLDKIFEPFFTTKPSGMGTGLGLSVSYGIVSDHSGYIDVISQPGKGATFTVWLPVLSASSEPVEQTDA